MVQAKTPRDHVNTIRLFLVEERSMREAVFKKNPTKQAAKVRDADEAIKSLIAIEFAMRKTGTFDYVPPGTESDGGT